MYKFKKIRKWESKPFVIYFVKTRSNGYQKYDTCPTLMQTIVVLVSCFEDTRRFLVSILKIFQFE
jgi:hypothetical protein